MTGFQGERGICRTPTHAVVRSSHFVAYMRQVQRPRALFLHKVVCVGDIIDKVCDACESSYCTFDTSGS